MEQSARKKILGLVGLGIRGRRAVVGVQQVRDGARRGKVKLALVAGDGSKASALESSVRRVDAKPFQLWGWWTQGWRVE